MADEQLFDSILTHVEGLHNKVELRNKADFELLMSMYEEESNIIFPCTKDKPTSYFRHSSVNFDEAIQRFQAYKNMQSDQPSRFIVDEIHGGRGNQCVAKSLKYSEGELHRCVGDSPESDVPEYGCNRGLDRLRSYVGTRTAIHLPESWMEKPYREWVRRECGGRPRERLHWHWYKDLTCYVVGRSGYQRRSYFEEKGYKIIEFSDFDWSGFLT